MFVKYYKKSDLYNEIVFQLKFKLKLKNNPAKDPTEKSDLLLLKKNVNLNFFLSVVVVVIVVILPRNTQT